MDDNPRSQDPDLETFERSIVLSGSCYTVVTIGGREPPREAEIENLDEVMNDWGDFPIGQNEDGLYYWTVAAYIHHPEVEGALQPMYRSFHPNRWSAFAAADQAEAQLRNPLAIAAGVDVAGDVSLADIRAMISNGDS